MNTPGEYETTGLYRSRDGMLLGVCKGVAEYLDLSVFHTRLVAALLILFTGLWAGAAIYLLAALVMKPEPASPLTDIDDEEFYTTLAESQTLALRRLRRTFDDLEHRLRRMEHVVTSREDDWDRRMDTDDE